MLRVDADVYEIDSDEWSQKEVEVEIPGICGNCGKSGIQKLMGITLVQARWGFPSGMFQTYCAACNGLTTHVVHYSGDEIRSSWSFPRHESEGRVFSDYIKENYKSFVSIYQQAEKAEQQGLNLICGVGYRKAVEFLVSGFLIKSQNEEQGWVENPRTTLGSKIRKIEDCRMQKLAQAITWIGNDETHYTRLHPEQDVGSMKKFIDALIATIEYNETYNDAIEFTEKKK